MVVFRRHLIPLESHQACFALVGKGVMPRATETLMELYSLHKSAEGVLEFTLRVESTFGSPGAQTGE